jgi:pantoate--beta-alanine ligase
MGEWQAYRRTLNLAESIGFVPTMGCLHAGHAALLQQARADNDIVVLSIYVNPMQFNEAADLDNYPRTQEADLQLAEKLGVDAVLLPSSEAMYGDGSVFSVCTEHAITDVGEGPSRPGHFDGMLTIVLKLLNLVAPTRAYFGEKDYQQLQLVQEMVTAFFLPVEIIPVPTMREVSGLALSSRNRLLSEDDREVADQFAAAFLQPEHSLESLRQALLALPLKLDYLLEWGDRWLVAVQVGSVRLIDNRARVV